MGEIVILAAVACGQAATYMKMLALGADGSSADVPCAMPQSAAGAEAVLCTVRQVVPTNLRAAMIPHLLRIHLRTLMILSWPDPP